MRRNPRDGLRDRWVEAVARSSAVGPSVKALLLYLAASGKVTARGALTFHRETVAATFGVHEQRVSAMVLDARNAGLLDRTGGGWNGRTSEYMVTLSDPEGARNPGTLTVPKVHESAAPSRTGNHAPFESALIAEGARNPGTHYARVTNASRERGDDKRDLRTDHITERRSEEEVAADSPVAAVLRLDRHQSGAGR